MVMARAIKYLLSCENDNFSAIYKILFYHRPKFYDASGMIGGFTVKQIVVLAIKQVETALQIARQKRGLGAKVPDFSVAAKHFMLMFGGELQFDTWRLRSAQAPAEYSPRASIYLNLNIEILETDWRPTGAWGRPERGT
jgi:hypothetical protein